MSGFKNLSEPAQYLVLLVSGMLVLGTVAVVVLSVLGVKPL